jgi:hypothetical protein
MSLNCYSDMTWCSVKHVENVLFTLNMKHNFFKYKFHLNLLLSVILFSRSERLTYGFKWLHNILEPP